MHFNNVHLNFFNLKCTFPSTFATGMGINDIAYSSTFFGYSSGLGLVFQETDDEDLIETRMDAMNESWKSFLKKRLSKSECKKFSNLKLFAYQTSYMACYERESRGDFGLLLGYDISDHKYVTKKSKNETGYNFNFAFPLNIIEIYIEFLNYFTSNMEKIMKRFGNCQDDEAEESETDEKEISKENPKKKVKKFSKDQFHLGICGSVVNS